MRFIDELRKDHRLIDQVAGSLFCWGDRGSEDPDAEKDLNDLLCFLRVFLHGFHHLREELLFRALVDHGEIPGDHGPLAILESEHAASLVDMDRIEAAGSCPGSETVTRRLAAELWQHLDKEETVLFPEAERRLIDGGIRQLEGPLPSDEVEAARALGLELIRRLPPMDDPDLIRGDGCIVCAAFGDTCHGIETEWWTDWEKEHYRSLDEG